MAFCSVAKTQRFHRLLLVQLPTCTRLQFSSGAFESRGDRLITLIDHFRDKGAGMWMGIYNARVWIPEPFDSGCDSDDGREFAKNWTMVRGYICAMDGLSEAERDSSSLESHCWCPSYSKQQYAEFCEAGARLTSEEAQKLFDRINETFGKDAKRALLVNALCSASVDGLSKEEIDGFRRLAEKLHIDKEGTDEAFALYELECQLKEKYDKYYSTVGM